MPFREKYHPRRPGPVGRTPGMIINSIFLLSSSTSTYRLHIVSVALIQAKLPQLPHMYLIDIHQIYLDLKGERNSLRNYTEHKKSIFHRIKCSSFIHITPRKYALYRKTKPDGLRKLRFYF